MRSIYALAIFCALALASQLSAAPIIHNVDASMAPGSPTSSSYPFNRASAVVQMQWTVAQMGGNSGKIEEFGYQFVNALNRTWPDVEIYLGETTHTPANWSSTFNNNFDAASAVKVYDGSISVNATTTNHLWRVPLDVPFNYSGQNTLVALVRVLAQNTGSGGIPYPRLSSGHATNCRHYNFTNGASTTGTPQANLLYGASFLISAGTTWTGANSSDWNDAGNWDGGEIPDDEVSVIIPNAATTANDPEMPAGGAEVLDLTIEAGGILVGNAGELSLLGSWTNEQGTFVPGTSLVRYVGTEAQEITTGDATVGSIHIENQAFSVSVTDAWSPTNTGTVTVDAGASMTFLSPMLDFTNSTFDNQGLMKLGLTDMGVTATTQSITTTSSVDLGNVAINVIDALDTVEFIGAATFNELSVNGLGTINFTSNLTIGGEFHVAMPGTLSIIGNIDGSGELRVSTMSPLTIGGSVDVGALTHDGEGDLSFGGAVTLTGDAKLLGSGPMTFVSFASDLVVGGDFLLDSSSLIVGDVVTIAGDLNVGGSATFEAGSMTIAQDFSTVGMVMNANSSINANGGNHSIGDLNFVSDGAVTLSGNVDAESILTGGAGDLSIGGDLTLNGDMTTASLGNCEISGNFSCSGPQMQFIDIQSSAVACNRLRITGNAGTTLTGPIEATSISGFFTALFVADNSGLILDAGADVAMGQPGGVGIANIRGSFTANTGAVSNRPLLRSANTLPAEFGRVRFRSTARVNLDGIEFRDIGATTQAFGIEIDAGSQILAFNSVRVVNSQANAAAIRLNTDASPTIFQNFSISGGAPANIDASGVSDIRIEVREDVTGSGNLYGVPNEMDPNGVLFWENPPVVSILTSSILPSVLAETTMSVQIDAIGGNEPLTYVLLNAPSWLSINATSGELTGMPPRAAVGAYTFAILVSDTSQPTNSESEIFTLIVDQLTEVPVTIVSDAQLLKAQEGKGYGFSLSAAGGSGSAFTWSLAVEGSLPTGLTLQPNGVIVGEVAEGVSGTFPFTAIAKDSQGNSAAKIFEMVVETQYSDPSIVNSILSDGSGGGSGGCALDQNTSIMMLMLLALLSLVVIRRREMI